MRSNRSRWIRHGVSATGTLCSSPYCWFSPQAPENVFRLSRAPRLLPCPSCSGKAMNMFVARSLQFTWARSARNPTHPLAPALQQRPRRLQCWQEPRSSRTLTVELSGRFLLEHGRGLVPLACLSSVLPRFLGRPATLHEESAPSFRRRCCHSLSHRHRFPPMMLLSHLIFRFMAVNPSVATEPGRLRMTFSREPVTAPASPTLTFGSKTIPSASYSESNGAAEITLRRPCR